MSHIEKPPFVQALADASGNVAPAWIVWFTKLWAQVETGSGPTADRPTKNLFVGKQWYDETLNKPIWVRSVRPTVWLDAVGKLLTGSATIDFASIAAGAVATADITVTGAAAGYFVTLSAPATLEAGLTFCGIANTDKVTIRLHNTTGAAIDPASATWKAYAFKGDVV